MGILYRVAPLVAFLLSLVLTFLVFRQKPRRSLHIAFAAFLLGMGLWGLTIFFMRSSSTLDQALPWEKGTIAVLPVVSLSFFHFVQILTGSRRGRIALIPGYVCAAASIALAPTGLIVLNMKDMWYGHGFQGGPLLLPYLLVNYGMVMAALVQLARAAAVSGRSDDRIRYTYMTIGGIMAMLGLTTDILASNGASIYPMGIIGNVLFSVLTTYAIVRYHLLDIYFVIRKSAAYVIVSILGLAIITAVFSGLYAVGLGRTRLETWQIAILIMVFAIALQPLLRWAQQRVDRWFDRGRHDYLKALESLGEQTGAIVDLRFIAESLVNTVSTAMKCPRVCVLLPDAENAAFAPVAGKGVPPGYNLRLPAHAILVWWLRDRRDILTRHEIETSPQFQALTAAENEILAMLGAEAFVPMLTREGLRGILVLGRKASDQDYSTEDMSLLRVVARQMVVTLDNARMYDIKDRRLKEQAMLTRLATVVSSELDLGRLYAGFLPELRSAVPVHFARIELVRKQDGTEIPAFTWASKPDLRLPEDATSVEEGLRRLGIISTVRLPLQSKSGPIGHLTLASFERDAYPEDNRRLLEQIAFQLAIAIDNSRLYDLERTTRQDLEKEYKERTEFVDALIHEVKTPITGMIASSELLKEELPATSPLLGDLAANLDVSVHNLNRRITELVDFVRLQNTEIALKVQPLNIDQFVREVGAGMNALLHAKEQTLEITTAPELGTVVADRERITQVLLNLLTNASKFSDNGTKMRLRAFPANGKAIIELADEAAPLTEQELERLFSPYQRGKRRSGGGLGLGLSICKKLVQMHGGDIWVESDKAGNKFSFSLPLTESEEKAREDTAHRR